MGAGAGAGTADTPGKPSEGTSLPRPPSVLGVNSGEWSSEAMDDAAMAVSTDGKDGPTGSAASVRRRVGATPIVWASGVLGAAVDVDVVVSTSLLGSGVETTGAASADDSREAVCEFVCDVVCDVVCDTVLPAAFAAASFSRFAFSRASFCAAVTTLILILRIPLVSLSKSSLVGAVDAVAVVAALLLLVLRLYVGFVGAVVDVDEDVVVAAAAFLRGVLPVAVVGRALRTDRGGAAALMDESGRPAAAVVLPLCADVGRVDEPVDEGPVKGITVGMAGTGGARSKSSLGMAVDAPLRRRPADDLGRPPRAPLATGVPVAETAPPTVLRRFLRSSSGSSSLMAVDAAAATDDPKGLTCLRSRIDTRVGPLGVAGVE